MISIRVSPTIGLIMVEEASLNVMIGLLYAWIGFEIGEKLF